MRESRWRACECLCVRHKAQHCIEQRRSAGHKSLKLTRACALRANLPNQIQSYFICLKANRTAKPPFAEGKKKNFVSTHIFLRRRHRRCRAVAACAAMAKALAIARAHTHTHDKYVKTFADVVGRRMCVCIHLICIYIMCGWGGSSGRVYRNSRVCSAVSR